MQQVMLLDVTFVIQNVSFIKQGVFFRVFKYVLSTQNFTPNPFPNKKIHCTFFTVLELWSINDLVGECKNVEEVQIGNLAVYDSSNFLFFSLLRYPPHSDGRPIPQCHLHSKFVMQEMTYFRSVRSFYKKLKNGGFSKANISLRTRSFCTPYS